MQKRILTDLTYICSYYGKDSLNWSLRGHIKGYSQYLINSELILHVSRETGISAQFSYCISNRDLVRETIKIIKMLYE